MQIKNSEIKIETSKENYISELLEVLKLIGKENWRERSFMAYGKRNKKE